MKHVLIFSILIFRISFLYSQNHCTEFDELFRKRHKIANMTYGHPYTMFDRHNKLSFEQTISNNKLAIDNKQNKKTCNT
jgi:hypothetical protein